MSTAAVPVLESPDRGLGGNINWTPLFDIIGSLPPGGKREVAVVQGLTAVEFAHRFSVNTSENETSVQVVRRLPEPKKTKTGPTLAIRERHQQPVVLDTTLHALLLAKLPDFNPDWTDAVKQSWFGTYEEVARMLIHLLPNRSTVIR